MDSVNTFMYTVFTQNPLTRVVAYFLQKYCIVFSICWKQQGNFVHFKNFIFLCVVDWKF